MDNLVIEKVIIPISECIPGMTLMQSIVDENTGATIVGKGQVLTEESIEKLSNFEHTQVWITIQSEANIWKVDSKTMEKYKAYAKMLRAILEDAGDHSLLSINKLVDLTNDIVKEFNDDYHLLACVNLINKLEKDTYEHSINVAFIALMMGRWAEYDDAGLKDLVLAALLHDVGKISLPSHICKKDKQDMNLMEKIEYRRHPVYGYERLASYNELSVEALKGVLSHHERCDGSGYPLSLRENKINRIAKIIGIADTYDYLKGRYHVFEVARRLGNTMMRKFDVNLLFQFCNNMINYYVGCSVLLNTGEIGEVAFIQPQTWGRPIIKVQDAYINLYEKTHLEIIKVI